ncbi:MAG: hypothetical protein ACLUC0_06215 [Clostridium neonatale]|uniref:hypothetical protein n=1 Tax=Clostridium neonatale TaxID=137838 RepID=UPI00291C0226|nr:hypothetical protein [Clostridium neonatale]CAI3543182.1 hypothetical protein CNEO3_240029 [Clostridium neonatale]
MAKHLFNFDFFKDDKIEDAYELLKYTLLLDCKDIDDITYNRKLKYDFLIHYGLLFEEEENVKEYEIDRKKFEEYSPEYKLMAIEYMSLEFMQDYIEGIGKELSEFDYVNYNIVKSYLDVYTKKMLAIYKRLDLSKGKLIKNIETYLNLNEENDLYITDETIEKIREEEETDEDASEEIIEDRIKEQLQYEQKKSREKHIRNCNSRIQKLKINEKINDLTLKQQMVEKSYSNIYLYILEKHSNYVHYDTENYKFEKCIKFIKNIDAANLELFDLYYIDKLCNISFQFEMLKFIYENKLNEIESNDLYNTFSSLKELPIFDKEILGMLLKQYKKLTSLNEKKQFEVKIRKLVYYILYYIIPLYNMIFPNVMKNIFKVKEFSGDSWEGYIGDLRSGYKLELERIYEKDYVKFGERIIDDAKRKIDKNEIDVGDKRKNRRYAKFIKERFKYINNSIISDMEFEKENFDIFSQFGKFGGGILNSKVDKQIYHNLLKKIFFNIVEARI